MSEKFSPRMLALGVRRVPREFLARKGQIMPGPRPTPTYLKLLRGNPGKQALPKNEPQPPREAEVPEPPPFLVGFASDEWWRVAPALHVMGLLTRVDIVPLAAYCDAYARWRLALETLARIGEKDTVTSGLIVRGSYGSAMPNPLVAIARKAASDMVRYASEFGFTPAARARIAAGPFADPGGPGGKFDGLLG